MDFHITQQFSQNRYVFKGCDRYTTFMNIYSQEYKDELHKKLTN